MINIRLYQFNPIVGDLVENTNRMLETIHQAKKNGISLIIFTELAVCGYPPMDLLERESFVETCLEMNRRLALSADGITVIWGSISKNTDKPGRPLYNSLYMAENGRISTIAHKSLLPTYDVFDEFRYFEPAHKFVVKEWKGIKLGLWYNDNDYHRYTVNPAKELEKLGADWIVNISASPFSKYKPNQRLEMLQRHCAEEKLPILYVNQVGANTEIIFDGDSMVLNADGSIVERSELFSENYIDTQWDVQTKRFKPLTQSNPHEMTAEERQFKALVLGLRDYVQKSGISQKVILGLSGGIDSALTATIAVEALGEENVIGVTMPSHFSSEGSVNDSVSLANNLGITIYELPIKSIYDEISDVLEPLFSGTEFNVAEENIQSRSRGILLMSISNKFGYLVLNTGNKSEMAVGYCTLYGDMAGGLSVLSDLYKVEVFAMSKWLNESYFKREIIPWNTINKPPSAELRPDQKDSDSLPEYEILDGILKAYIEEKASIKAIIAKGYDELTVKRVIRLVDLNEYKRRQAPPGLRISSKAFGMGRRLPIVQKWTQVQLK
jgi:NAD+ synthetase